MMGHPNEKDYWSVNGRESILKAAAVGVMIVGFIFGFCFALGEQVLLFLADVLGPGDSF